MKRFFLYIMLTLLVSETTSLYQLLKVPQLYGHFAEHKALNHNISFLDYLSMHYWGQDLNDNDDEKDMQLPFKKYDVHTPGFLFVPAAKLFVARPVYLFMKSNFNPDRPQVYFNPALGSLFRPPRA